VTAAAPSRPDVTAPYRCYRADRCAEWDWWDSGIDGFVRVGATINSTLGLCPACCRHLACCLVDLPRDYTELNMIIGKSSASALTEPVATTRELPTPLRLPIEALQASMVWETSCWAEPVAERLEIDWDSHDVAHSRPGAVLQRATRLLGNALSVLLAVRDWTVMVWDDDGLHAGPELRNGVDGAVAVMDLHHKARHYTGMTRLVHRQPIPCPTCQRRALCRDNGDTSVYCVACHRVYTEDDYSILVSALAQSRPLTPIVA
jgi:hypothetical protein